jgi:rod shape-determining protein MreC
MESFFVRFKNPLMLIAIVLAQVIALAVQVKRPVQGVGAVGSGDTRTVSMLRRWSVAVVTPFERVAQWTSGDVKAGWTNYIDLRHTRERDEQLKLEVARLREEQAAFAEDAAQGRRLQALLALKQQYIAATVAAQVIGTSGSDRSRVVYLDKGSADGLKPEQAVITPTGVVGKLRDVWEHTAQVLLIDDASSGAGVVLVSSRIRGILRGTSNGRVEIDNLTADSRIKAGEQVVTSGGDLVFPRGLPVGVIESIAPDPQHQPYTEIMIKPAANLAQLAEVLVITGTQSTLPGSAQADAEQAEATAQERQRAADAVADRLPSLKDEAGAAKGADAAGATEPAAPKRQYAVRPDRYSPGVTPPAEELRPGVAPPPVVAKPPVAKSPMAKPEGGEPQE